MQVLNGSVFLLFLNSKYVFDLNLTDYTVEKNQLSRNIQVLPINIITLSWRMRRSSGMTLKEVVKSLILSPCYLKIKLKDRAKLVRKLSYRKP
jgi:hypothetical protein